MIATAKITSKGQTTLPAEVRAKLKVQAGDHVRYVELEDGGFRIEKASSSFEDLRGIIKLGRPVSMDDILDAVDQARAAMGAGVDRP